MSQAIIFDYNRTIFNPETNALMDGVLDLISQLRKQKYVLYVISKGNNEREEQIQRLGLRELFDDLIVVEEKHIDQFRMFQERHSEEMQWTVIGDRVRKEIRYGNMLGMKTIWLKKGKFSVEEPETVEEEPDNTIYEIAEVLEHLEPSP